MTTVSPRSPGWHKCFLPGSTPFDAYFNRQPMDTQMPLCWEVEFYLVVGYPNFRPLENPYIYFDRKVGDKLFYWHWFIEDQFFVGQDDFFFDRELPNGNIECRLLLGTSQNPDNNYAGSNTIFEYPPVEPTGLGFTKDVIDTFYGGSTPTPPYMRIRMYPRPLEWLREVWIE